jgi:hypothetical protein
MTERAECAAVECQWFGVLEDPIMKRYLIPMVVVLTVLAVVWTAFGRPQEAATQRRGMGRMSEEERAKMRERWQNMSEEEREKFRAQMRERFAGRGAMFGREAQLEAIKAIEGQLAKLKAGIEAQPERPSFQDLSEEQRAKLREQFAQAREERQTAIRTILAQVARLQGQRPPAAEGEEFVLMNTGDLKSIRELAVKENAKETADRLERLITRGQRGFGRFPGRQPGQPGQPGQRGTRQRPQRGERAPGAAR